MVNESELYIDQDDHIVITFHGKQSGPGIKALGAKLDKAAAEMRAKNKKVLIISDARGLKLSDVTSAARIEGKKVLQAPFDGNAVISKGHLLQVFLYLAQASGQSHRIKFFRDARKAHHWLDNVAHPKQPPLTIDWLFGGLIMLTGLAALWGWHSNNTVLTAWLTGLRPINPMGAVGLVLLGYALIAWRFQRIQHVIAMGWLLAALGLAGLLPLSIDHLLFGTEVSRSGVHTPLADTASLCFLLIGLVLVSMRFKANRLLFLMQCTVTGFTNIFAVALIYGMVYAHDFVYGVSNSFILAFNLATGLALGSLALFFILLHRRRMNVLTQVSRIGWLIIAAVIGLQLITYVSWRQSIERNKADSSQAFLARADAVSNDLKQRLQAYIDALYGFRGLFGSSDSVDQGEFESYYDSIDLEANYPGLRTVAYISKVDTKDLPAFVAQRQKDTSLNPGGNPNYKIVNQTNQPVHYLLTYNANSPVVASTNDLSSVPDRVELFLKATQTNKAVTSQSITLPASATGTKQRGFFITLPMNNKHSSNVIGFVTVVFNYKDFFANSLTIGEQKNVNVTVTDARNNEVLYSHKQANSNAFSYSKAIAVADSTWQLQVKAPANFGISESQTRLPLNTLVSGQILTLIMIAVFFMQNRSRKEALNLADQITEDLQTERNLAMANEQKSSAILESIGDAVFAIEPTGKLTLFNGVAQRVSGFSEAEAIGKPYDQVLRFEFEKTGKVNNHFVKQALAGHVSSMSNHTVIVRKDGARIPVADSAAPIRDMRGKIVGVIVVFRDVSKEYELDKAKTEFVSLASHQLRTPLSAINWYGEMLLNGDAGKLSKDQKEYVQEIYEGNQRMVELVNSLLDVSRLELGRLTNKPQPTNINDVITSIQKELAVIVANRGLHVSRELDTKLPLVNADPKLLRMIVQNLLSNAAKYTSEKGDISVTLRRATAHDVQKANVRTGRDYWYFSVKDTGYGIPKNQQDKIFSKLFRADNVRALDVEGTGLGLYIVKEVVEKLGGRVWFDSVESVGGTFYVVLPFSSNK